MRKRVIGTSGILLLFSLFVTAVLIASFILYIKLIPAPKLDLPSYLANVNNDTYAISVEQGSRVIPIDTINGFFAKEEIDKLYLSAIITDLPYLLIFIIFVFTTSAIALSVILKKQQEKQAVFFAKQLTQIDDNGISIPAHPAIAKAYAELKRRLEANMRDYVRLSAYVTHEQKNILSLLRAKLQLAGNNELTADVDNVVDSLDDILTLGASTKNADIEIIDTALVCAGVCDEYKRIYPDIVFDFDDGANTQIASKELWISRALSNLLSNAIKYAGGTIEVSVTNRNGSVIITVSDEGDGINENELDRLFDYQSRVGKLNKDGYGIGLSLVRHVCDICGGIALADNRREKGAIFFMVFPEALTLD